MINHTWHTPRLRIADSRAEDLPQLEQVLISNSATFLLDGTDNPHADELRRWLMEGDLPPGGRLNAYRLQTISRADNCEVIGYLSVYHGYPDMQTLYISSFFIKHDCQGNGFGAEVMRTMPELDGLSDYPKYRLVVTVRNWGALRFWTKCGFTTIVRIEGDLNADTGYTARLELLRDQT